MQIIENSWNSRNFEKQLRLFRITLSGFTLVTALLDIGRGDWWEYRRPMESYYFYLENVLRLKVNLVIFVDHKSVRHIYSRRKEYRLDHITKVSSTPHLYAYLHQKPWKTFPTLLPGRKSHFRIHPCADRSCPWPSCLKRSVKDAHPSLDYQLLIRMTVVSTAQSSHMILIC